MSCLDMACTCFQLWLFWGILLTSIPDVSASKQPNIVILMVDDLGVADLGCFGNDSIKTPNVDKLAREGARLTHSVASASICTPSRAAFLTGRYAVRSGMAARPNRTRVLIYTSAPGGLPRNETTFAKILANDGYSTGWIGKWHLGLNKRFANDFHYHPLNHGFQFFYGLPFTNYYPCATQPSKYHLLSLFLYFVLLTVGLSLTARLFIKTKSVIILLFLSILLLSLLLFNGVELESFHTALKGQMDCFLMRDFQVVEQPLILENLTVRLTNEAVRFITDKQASPFLLYMSYVKVHTPLFTTKQFKGHSGHSEYADNVEEMDWSVGQILNTLDRLGIRNNTFVYFTSDHGPHLEEIYDGVHHGGWKGHFKGGKGQNFEGGIRVPSIVSWPSQIPSGIDINEPTISLDMFPTILHIANASLPNDRIIDGHNIMPLLKQQVDYAPTEFMFHYCGESLHAVRYRPRSGTITWKALFITPKWFPKTEYCELYECCGCYGDAVQIEDPPLLYDITSDPSERNALDLGDPSYEPVMQRIKQAVEEHRMTLEEVPNQLEDNLWYPWRQTCCNYPLCWCKETNTTSDIQEE